MILDLGTFKRVNCTSMKETGTDTTYWAGKAHYLRDAFVIFEEQFYNDISIQPLNGWGSIKIYDMSGRKNLILDITEQKNVEIDLSQLAKGMYMVHTINRNGHESRAKVVVYE